VLEIVCWLAVMVVFCEIMLCSERDTYIRSSSLLLDVLTMMFQGVIPVSSFAITSNDGDMFPSNDCSHMMAGRSRCCVVRKPPASSTGSSAKAVTHIPERARSRYGRIRLTTTFSKSVPLCTLNRIAANSPDFLEAGLRFPTAWILDALNDVLLTSRGLS
jgi:hypothetical protein